MQASKNNVGLWKSVVFSLFIFSLFFMILEVIQRVRHPQTDYETLYNTKGFRNREFETKKAEGAVRIVFLGGSTTVGIRCGLDETFPVIVGEVLNDRLASRRIETINAAKTGKTSSWILRRLREIMYLQPDIVVIMTGYNDSALVYNKRLQKTGDDVEAVLPWYAKWDRAMARHSVFYLTLREKIAVLLYQKPYYAFDRPLDSIKSAGEGQREWFRIYPEFFRENLEKITVFSKERGVKLIWLRPPLSAGRAENDPLYREAFSKLMEELKEVAEKYQTPVIDLSGLFNRGDERLYYFDGVHFTPLGNRMIAGKIIDYFFENKDRYFIQ